MMDFTVMFIFTITLVLYFSPSAYSGTYVNLTAILSAPGAPFLTLLSLLQTENVIQVLQEQANSQQGLTLFAPNDVAFARDNVPWGDLSLAQTQSLLLFHAIPHYFSATLSELHTLSQASPITTMAGVQYTLNVTIVSNTLYLNSGWTIAQMLAAVDLTTYPTEVYQIDKILMPEAIFGTNIPPPPSLSTPATAPSGLVAASTPNYNKSGNYPPIKSRTGLSGGVIAGICIGVIVGLGALLVVVCCVFCRKEKVPEKLSNPEKGTELHHQTGKDSKSLLAKLPQRASNGDKNTNTREGGSEVHGDVTTMEGGVNIHGHRNNPTPIIIGSKFVYNNR